MAKNRKERWTALALAAALALSAAACGGADTKETEAGVESAPTQQEETRKERDQETAKEESLESYEEASSEAQVPKEQLYTITRDDIDDLVTDFLQMQADVVLKADSKELGRLEPIDLMDRYAGMMTADERYKVVADYNTDALMGLKNTQEILLASQRRFYREYGDYATMYYQVGVSVTESNIKENGGFRYYGGTDATIGAMVKFNFFYSPDPFKVPYFLGVDPASFGDSYGDIYNSEEDAMSCPNLCVVLVNCGEDDWGIQFLVADRANDIAEGEAFTGVLTNEDEKEAEAAIVENQGTETIDWKKVYLDEIKSGQLDPAEEYCLKDINGNGIPELFTTSSFGYYQGVVCYIKRDGTADYIGSAYGYTADKIATGTERQGVIIDGIYQYDSGTGEYRLIFNGYVEEDFVNDTVTYEVNRQVCEEQEYKDRFAAAWNPDHYDIWEECQPVSDKTLIQAIAEYDDSGASGRNYFTAPGIGEESQAPQESRTFRESGVFQESQGSLEDSRDYILPDVAVRYLTESEIRSLSKEEMRLARNEVYARHGRKFDSEDLQVYFNSKPWYNGFIASKDFDETLLNEYEIANLDLIRAVEGE